MPPDGPPAIPDRFDLEALAGGYIHRPISEAAIARARRAISGLAPRVAAIDVGGGTGQHAAIWAAQGVRAVVIDPSTRMTSAASQQPGVIAVVGRSEQLPLAPGAAGLVYFHLSVHYGDWRRAMEEAWRVLAPGGRLVVWTLGPEHHRQAMIMRYFPQLLAVDLERFPDPVDIAGHLAQIGATVDRVHEVEHKRMPARSWADAVRGRFISTLQLLGTAEIDEGLARFVGDHPDPSTEVEYALLFTGLVANR